eukprot:8338337-Lingulodinium_polyedra.AAC.1
MATARTCKCACGALRGRRGTRRHRAAGGGARSVRDARVDLQREVLPGRLSRARRREPSGPR